jgi:hypothetical protein
MAGCLGWQGLHHYTTTTLHLPYSWASTVQKDLTASHNIANSRASCHCTNAALPATFRSPLITLSCTKRSLSPAAGHTSFSLCSDNQLVAALPLLPSTPTQNICGMAATTAAGAEIAPLTPMLGSYSSTTSQPSPQPHHQQLTTIYVLTATQEGCKIMS